MRSVGQLINLVIDGEVSTVEAARIIIADEVAERVHITGGTTKHARAVLLENVGYCSGYCTHEQADRIMELYETEHPVFGKKHPSPEEALELGIQHGKRARERGLLGDKKSKTK
jgi:hypothetical protein